MAVATTNLSTFTPFLGLPRELRDQIWHDALPDKVGSALYFYKKGCWCPRRLSESDEGYDHENDESNLNLEFRYDFLDDAQFEIPLVFVNREARTIALAWVREQGIEIRSGKDRQNPVSFVRPFDPTHDALYVGHNEWDGFLCEPEDRLYQPDLLERYVEIKPNLARIAVPEALLRSEITTLHEILQHYFYLKVLLVVVDAQSDLHSVENNERVQRRWEVESIQGEAFLWDPDCCGFKSEDWKPDGDEALYTLIEDACHELGESIARDHIRNFEVRPVFAVRR